MRFNTVAGCCAAYNIANLGYAHGHSRARNQEEFELRFRNKPLARMNFAITNPIQGVEREYLSKMGFKSIAAGDLQMHVISSTDLRKYMAEREPHLRAYEDEKKKQKAEIKTSKFNRAAADGLFMGVVTSRQIENLRPRNYTGTDVEKVGWRAAIARFYGVTPIINRWTDNTVRAVRLRTYRALYEARQRGF